MLRDRRTFTSAAAGAAAGMFARTAVAPIDRVKLLLQLRGSIQHQAQNNTNPFHMLRGIIRNEGFFSLWRGNSPTILTEGGVTALNFAFLSSYKAASVNVLASLEQHYPSLRMEIGGGRKRRLLQSFVSGGLAGATTISFLYPLGFMRTRLATDVGTKGERMYPNGMRDVLRKIWISDGIRGFYKGYGIALVSVSLHRLVYLGGYDFIKSEVESNNKQQDSKQQMSLVERFGVAQIVSMSASTIHYPLDSVRRRLMMEAGKKEQERKYQNTIHCFRRIWAEEGHRGFYRGLSVKLVQCVGSALALVSYDEFKRLLVT